MLINQLRPSYIHTKETQETEHNFTLRVIPVVSAPERVSSVSIAKRVQRRRPRKWTSEIAEVNILQT